MRIDRVFATGSGSDRYIKGSNRTLEGKQNRRKEAKEYRVSLW
jgi:hypothetical protein